MRRSLELPRKHRVVITKDADFVNSFLLARQSPELLLVSTGNITNADLEVLFIPEIPSLAATFEAYDYVELTPSALVIHV